MTKREKKPTNKLRYSIWDTNTNDISFKADLQKKYKGIKSNKENQ